MNKKFLVPILFSIILLSIPVNQAYACDFVVHPERCVKEVIADVVNPVIDGVKNDIKKIDQTLTGDIKKVEGDVLSLETDVVKELETIGKDVVSIAKDVESVEKAVVSDIVTDTKKIEQAITNDLVNDVKDVKADVAKIEKLVVSVENIEKKIVNTTEEVIKTIITDIENDWIYVIYGLIAIGVGYIVIRITQFAIWLKAYLRQDGIEHSAKKQVAQNDEIIKLLKELTNK